METHIYIATDGTSPKMGVKAYAYILECRVAGEIKTRGGFGEVPATYHQAVLTAISAALERFRQPCEITIHTEDIFVLSMIEQNLDRWAENDFMTSKGMPVANRKEWKKIWNLSTEHLLLGEPGKHTYTDWLKMEIKKRKGERHDV